MGLWPLQRLFCIDCVFLSLNFFFSFWLRWIFVAESGLSLVALSGGYSSSWCKDFSLQWHPSLRSIGSVAVANGLSWNGWQVESSRTRD